MSRNKGPHYNKHQEQQMRFVAEAIDEYLKKFEADPSINTKDDDGVPRLLNASASASKRFVWVYYNPEHIGIKMDKGEAEEYFLWLERGNIGLPFDWNDKYAYWKVPRAADE